MAAAPRRSRRRARTRPGTGPGGFIETALPEPGHYLFVSHSMVDVERGARGLIAVH
jgi:hypothetical protein